MQNLVQFHQFVLKILSGNEILISIKGINSVINLQKLTQAINAYAKFGQIQSIRSRGIKQKQSIRMESQHDRQPENSITPQPYFVCGVIIIRHHDASCQMMPNSCLEWLNFRFPLNNL